MGWGGGVSIFDDVVGAVYDHLDPAVRVGVLTKIVNIIWDNDCDTFDDSIYLDGKQLTLRPDVKRALMNAGWFI